MSSAVADFGPVRPPTSRTEVPKPRLFLLLASAVGTQEHVKVTRLQI